MTRPAPCTDPECARPPWHAPPCCRRPRRVVPGRERPDQPTDEEEGDMGGIPWPVMVPR